MPQDEQSQPRRRRTNTGEQDTSSQYAKTIGKSVGPTTRTEGYPDEGLYDPPRQHTSTIRRDNPKALVPRYTGAPVSPAPIQVRRQPQQPDMKISPRSPRTTTSHPPQERKFATQRNFHWLFPAGIGMIAMLVLWMVGSSVLAWGVQRYDDYRYGVPRTFQMDAVVGHGGDSRLHPSHFIAMNLNRQAIVVEFMAGDPAKSVSYVAPVYIAGDGGDLAPITLEFRDVAGNGRLDMVIHIHLPSQDQVSVFINDGTKFRPSSGSDKIRI
ncbi:MAG TPA: hypothetical protein VFU49_08545 [Ktedonobacteraceae bacterium]|nr:hypothetical protein [Ktedonobacteraceae bacterium]